MAWVILAPLSYYPNFLSYISEYGPGRDRGSEILVDSSLDWGQGLLQLREYMREQGIERVYLSYFGSARPDGYGIDYVPTAEEPWGAAVVTVNVKDGALAMKGSPGGLNNKLSLVEICTR